MAFKSYQAGGIPANFQQAQSNTHMNAQADRAQIQLLPTLTGTYKEVVFHRHELLDFSSGTVYDGGT